VFWSHFHKSSGEEEDSPTTSAIITIPPLLFPPALALSVTVSIAAVVLVAYAKVGDHPAPRQGWVITL
jgi:hypothetical protein